MLGNVQLCYRCFLSYLLRNVKLFTLSLQVVGPMVLIVKGIVGNYLHVPVTVEVLLGIRQKEHAEQTHLPLINCAPSLKPQVTCVNYLLHLDKSSVIG